MIQEALTRLHANNGDRMKRLQIKQLQVTPDSHASKDSTEESNWKQPGQVTTNDVVQMKLWREREKRQEKMVLYDV